MGERAGSALDNCQRFQLGDDTARPAASTTTNLHAVDVLVGRRRLFGQPRRAAGAHEDAAMFQVSA